MAKAFSRVWIITVIAAAAIAGAILVWQKFNTRENTSADWQTYTNQQYGFEIKYPSDWKAAKNILSLEPNLVFCPDSLATDSDPQVICKMEQGGAGSPKPVYAKGMVYLFLSTYGKSKNPAYRYLGFDAKGIYYLHSDSVDNQAITDAMVETFKFFAPESVAPFVNSIQFSSPLKKEFLGSFYGYKTGTIMTILGKYSDICLAASAGPGIEVGCTRNPITRRTENGFDVAEFKLNFSSDDPSGYVPLCHRLSDFHEIHLLDENKNAIKKISCGDMMHYVKQ